MRTCVFVAHASISLHRCWNFSCNFSATHTPAQAKQLTGACVLASRLPVGAWLAYSISSSREEGAHSRFRFACLVACAARAAQRRPKQYLRKTSNFMHFSKRMTQEDKITQSSKATEEKEAKEQSKGNGYAVVVDAAQLLHSAIIISAKISSSLRSRSPTLTRALLRM